jgi:amino acid adenylation domain-containing protein
MEAIMSKFTCFVIGNGVVPLKCLEILLQAGHQILGVYSTDRSLDEWAKENHIPHATSRRNFQDDLLSTQYDYLFSINNGWIIPADIITQSQKATINYHDSPLPKYAGLHATSWALLHGETQHAITWHEVVPEIDAGRILKQKIVPIYEDDIALSLNTRCFEQAVVAFEELVHELAENRTQPFAQDLSERSYFGPSDRPEAACILSFQSKTQDLYNLSRGLDFGPVRNPLGLPKLRLWSRFVAVGSATVETTVSGRPGQVLALDADGLCIATADSAIRLGNLTTLAGTSLSEAELQVDYGVQVGVVLPELEDLARDQITQHNAAICRHERMWVKQLMAPLPFNHPYLLGEASSRSSKGKLQRVAIEVPISAVAPRSLLALFATYCARVSTESAFDLVLQTSEQRSIATQIFAQQVPIRVQAQDNISFSHFRDQFEVALEQSLTWGNYALDIFARHPELRDLSAPNPFAMAIALVPSPTELDWESLGASVCLVAYEDGSCPEVLHDGALDDYHGNVIAQQLQVLITACLEQPNQPLHLLPLLSEVQRKQILVDWNQTEKWYPCDRTIHELFTEQAARTPHASAVRFGTTELNYRELDERSNQLAHWLSKLGIAPDTLVVLCVPRSVEMIVGLLGILKAGGAYVPIDPTYPADRIAYLLEDSRPQAIVTIGTIRNTLFDGADNIICLDDHASILAEFSSEPLATEVTPENLAYVIYTSGSTGKPKGVEIQHRSLVNHSWAIADNYGLGLGDRLLQSASISFDVAGEQIYPALFRGAEVVIRPNDLMESFARFSEFVASQSITAMILPTAFWHEWTVELLESGQNVPHSLRVLSVGTEKALGHRLEQWQTVSEGRVSFFQGYGPTEATVTCTMYKHDDNGFDPQAVLSIGRPLPNTEIYILDRHLQPVPVGMVGDLYVGGDGLARGYYQRPDLSEQRFIAHPFGSEKGDRLYKTGDLARFEPDGQILYCGRTDDQIKLNGFRIELGEIEMALNTYPAVKQGVIQPQEVTAGVRSLVAYVVPNPELDFAVADLQAFLKQNLPVYMLPNAVVEMQDLPLTPNGKVNRQGLPKPTLSKPLTSETATAPSNAIELQLVQMWETVLGVQSIGTQDNYFELGGTSLQAVRLFSQIEKVFGKSLPLSALLGSPTVQKLAALLNPQNTSESCSILVPIQETGSKPPLFCIHGGGFNVLIYRSLAVKLGADYPVYGLQAPGLTGDGPMFERLEDMAAEYIQEIQRIQPEGPYFLAGLSNGGNVALEMAQQFKTQGQTVSLLAMFDSYGPDAVKLLPPFPRLLSALHYAIWHSGPEFIAKHWKSGPISLLSALHQLGKAILPISRIEPRLSSQKIEEQNPALPLSGASSSSLEDKMNRVSQYILDHSPWAFFSPSQQLQNIEGSLSKTLKQLEVSYSAMHKAYIPKPYSGQILLFRAKEFAPGHYRESKLGWGKIANNVQVHDIPGHHVSLMESNVLAKKMQACLLKVI